MTAPKFTKMRVAVRNNWTGRSQETDAYTLGGVGLVVTRCIDSNATERDWHVTHIRTGANLHYEAMSAAKAKALLLALIAHVDGAHWSEPVGSFFKYPEKSWLDKAAAILREVETR